MDSGSVCITSMCQFKMIKIVNFIMYVLLSHVQLCWSHGMQQTRLPCPFLISWSLLKVMLIEFVILSNHLILCHPLLLMPSIFPSIKVFPNESALCIRWPKYWSFSFSISPFSKYSGLISFRIDWFEHHSSKASILWCSAFFMVQLSHPHMTTGKTIDLTIWTFDYTAE